MPAFEMVCVGTGGGPDETNLSAYLLKPYGSAWQDGIIAIEAGSGQGALRQIVARHPDFFTSSAKECKTVTTYSAAEIYSFIRCFLITHAHLDHVNSLVMSAGSLKGPRKRVYAAEETLKDLEGIFADRLWPNLASWKEDDEAFKLLYTILSSDNQYKSIYPDVSLRMLPVNHGTNGTGTYDSAAFFIKHDPSNHEFLFFGDVEPDSISQTPRNIEVWRIAAPKIPGTLSTLFIECSWPSGRPNELLYGHLSPEHLVSELEALAAEVVKVRKRMQRGSHSPARKKRKNSPTPIVDLRGALDGLRVFVMHCKDTMDDVHDQPINRVIVEQVRALVVEKGLGAEILAAEQGMRIEI